MTTKTIMPCKNCPTGTVMREGDGRLICRLCARPHTENGELIKPIAADKYTKKGRAR